VNFVGFYYKNIFIYLFVSRLLYYFRLSFCLLKPFSQYFGVRATNEGCGKCPQMFVGKPRGMGPRWREKGSWYLTLCQCRRALECKCDLSVVSDRFQAFVNGSELLVPGNSESVNRKDSVIRNYSVIAWKWNNCGVEGPG
jgi:hypothetical protein